MKEEFEKLESVDEMLEYLIANKKESKTNVEKKLEILNVEIFLKLFDCYQILEDKEKEELEQCALIFNDTENNAVVQQSALYHVCDLFAKSQEKLNKEINRKNDKIYETPCEDCNGKKSTHLIQFRQENRLEEHFLCEDCEEAAMKSTGDE